MEIEITRALKATQHVDAMPDVLRVARAGTGLRFAALTRAQGHTWTALAVSDSLGLGIKVGESLDSGTTLCAMSRSRGNPMVVGSASDSPEFHEGLGRPFRGLESFVTAPIYLSNGTYFGNLCALDSRRSAVEDEKVVAVVQACAELAGKLVESALAHSETLASLDEAGEIGESREEFIAVVAHDFRNPLATFGAAAELLARSGKEGFSKLGQRLGASARRMSGLIDDLVDFARGRSGAAMTARLEPREDLNARLGEVVGEMLDAHPGRAIRRELALDGSVDSDATRLQQALSNLLGNALAYDDREIPVVVEASTDGDEASLVVTNWGSVIPRESLQKIFHPFFRGTERDAPSHMGLGLYICSQIARAHRGRLTVTSTEKKERASKCDGRAMLRELRRAIALSNRASET